MATYTGTTGNDRLTGTSANDIFLPLSGQDSVNGGNGFDQLIVDYSVFKAHNYQNASTMRLDASGLTGAIRSQVSNDSVSFSRVEALDVRLGSGNDYVSFRAEIAMVGISLVIDAGGGRDQLTLALAPVGDVTFTVDTTGLATTSFGGRFTGFEDYNLTLGKGAHHIATGAGHDRVTLATGSSQVDAGAGDDSIITRGGHDIIDGGAGYDSWIIQMATSSKAQNLTVNSLTGQSDIAGLASATGMERIEASLGAGADQINLTDARGTFVQAGAGADLFIIRRPEGIEIDGGSGIDTAKINMSRTLRFYESVLTSNGAGGVDGYLSLYNGVKLTSIERLSATLSDGDDQISVDGDALARGAILTLNGGVGQDHLTLDLSALTAVTLTPSADGTVQLLGSSFSGFESLRLIGTAGNDRLGGIAGSNYIDGAAGNDSLIGTAGNDLLLGGDGDDRLYGMGGRDELHGGMGNDFYYIDTDDYSTLIYENAGEGLDILYSSVSMGLFDNVERLQLTGSADIAGTGTDADDILVGNVGDNRLQGLGGKDILSGGAGMDILIGGDGADRLTGGAGADLFWFDRLGSAADRDLITDFAPGSDALVFVPDGFPGLSTLPAHHAIPASTFVAGTAATNAAQHFIYDEASGSLYYDSDGAGGASQTLVATFTGLPHLTASDIFIA
ncbi:Ca2+-binding protein, RTX toxin-related [Sphingobium sp. AP50]|uniref:calcium-binding protein n=1 Tax=Sphingobium sp. AP50 TaxID=1884369 RepID=UPI0008BB931D|nr:calcium-binding protein [Sphingobium sp. AP50]SEJ33540.1 Ca2+-binding protein, RTX toxin-related [Sphingobium sp. AP50]